MRKLIAMFGTSSVLLTACAVAPETSVSDKISQAEAKRLACPESVLEAGASAKDCSCVEDKLYTIGQTPGAIKYDNAAPQSGFGGVQGARDIAIGILRLDAFEHCGMFDPDHPVSKNL